MYLKRSIKLTIIDTKIIVQRMYDFNVGKP